MIGDATNNDPRLEWWKRPVEGWPHGLLKIRNLTTGELTILDLQSGEMLDAAPPEREPSNPQWWGGATE